MTEKNILENLVGGSTQPNLYQKGWGGMGCGAHYVFTNKQAPLHIVQLGS